jgi:hypothetical protein
VDGTVCVCLWKPKLKKQVRSSGVVTMESPGAQWQSSKALMPNAPLESKAQCHSILGKIFNFVPGNGIRNVGVGSHSWIVVGAEPDTHQFYVTICFKGVIEWIETQEDISLTQKTGLGM